MLLVVKILAVLLFLIGSVAVVKCFYHVCSEHLFRHADEQCVGELFGAIIIGACLAALFGALIQLDLPITMIVVGVLACVCWAAVAWLWQNKRLFRTLKAVFLSTRMVGMACTLAVAMLPLCRMAA